jgi:hypothetical protein
MGLTLVVTTIALLTLVISAETTTAVNYRVIPAANAQIVLNQVAAATKIISVPTNLEPSLSMADSDYVGWGGILHYGCAGPAATSAAKEEICTLGDPVGKKLMVIYGDSHALMWLPALEGIASASHWRLIILAKYFCPAEMITVSNPPGLGRSGGRYTACDRWHQWSIASINRLHPNLVVVSQESLYTVPGSTAAQPKFFSAFKWNEGMTRLLSSIAVPGAEKVILGNIPLLPRSGPECLGAHSHDVQACSATVQASTSPLDEAERSAGGEGTQYVDPTPWFCSAMCTAVIGRFNVYQDQFHITGTYAKYLQNALAEALRFAPSGSP